jgi:DNA-binding LacI/PurR family transcriptional regulator
MQQTDAIKRALAYLQEGIKKELWHQTGRLPIVRILARDTRVAYAAMQTAISLLARKGQLTIEPKKGVYIGKREPAYSPAEQRVMRWELVKQSLRQDMLNGAFEDQLHLPNIRQLQKHYSVSLPTLRKAIRALMTENALVYDRKKYRIVRIKRAVQFTSILLISPGVSRTKVKLYSDKFKEFYQTLENRCIRSNIQLAWCGAAEENLGELTAYLNKNREFFGYCLFDITPSLAHAILRQLAGRGRPIAVVDEGGGFIEPAFKCPYLLFSSAAVLAGRQVGQFLRELGHKRIAFVSLRHHAYWSQKRFLGVTQAFEGESAADRVKLLAIEHPDTALIKGDPAIVRDVEKMTGVNEGFPWRKSIPSLEEFEHIKIRIRNLFNLRGLYDILIQQFSDLLKDTSITAFVGSNDLTAILAHEFLKQEGVSVPKEISLCGFDNAEAAIEDDLTSYNFLFGNLAADILAYIINPSGLPFAGRRTIECSGAIIQRSSTGPAK